ncbi:hypothetical protein MASR2M47_26250 [Draconibacterium sp.]|jgi:hypothetical protein
MSLIDNFPERVDSFIRAANNQQLRMVLVGGGAVNFHGFQRHSADIDFWIDITEENLKKLHSILNELGYLVDELPEKVKTGQQNISIKISPVFELELITNFNPGKTFDEAFNQSVFADKGEFSYHVLNYYDLINSKITSERIKDKMDVEELQRINFQRRNKS